MSHVQRSGFARAYSPRIAGGLSLLLLRLCAVILFASSVLAQSLSGRATVVDGDTLVIGDTRIRLNAIDAPETDQTCLDAKSRPFACGIVARDRLRQKIGESTVSCTSEGEDRYGRTLGICRLDSEDLNRWLVAEGLALSYVQYSDQYSNVEEHARRNKKGLGAGAFTAPWDWRHRTPKTPLLGAVATQADRTTLDSISPSAPPVADCTIKGNVNRQGDRIYFLPGNSAYGKVRMDKGLGERWFCSEEEALSAGWRKARNDR